MSPPSVYVRLTAVLCLSALAGFSLAACQVPASLSSNVVTFDVSAAPAPPQPLPMTMGGLSPAGHRIEVNSRYLILDGKPWLPVMGEFHFSRYPEAQWEDELLKMKAAGIQIVATYVFWIHHEETEGQFDWSGQRDLRRFIELCAKHQLYTFVRIGPFAHGEVRNGGLPDWIVQAGSTRRNSPGYLAHVERYYNEIGRQLHGLLWKDGGPVIGVQLENEYSLKGPDAGAAHIATLKKMAMAAGLDVPLYTVTGWDNADYPADEVLPVFGVYPDEFWSSSLQPLPPSYAYVFSFPEQPGKQAGTLAAGAAPASTTSPLPQLLAEAGGGMQVAYHRRPVVSAADVAAIAITHLGSGANLYGYYMFHGGANPIGKKSTMQESAAVDGVYDLPVISYDFRAPLGQYGELRPSFRQLKSVHYFLNQFGDRLAPMTVYRPDRVPSGPDDSSTPRVALRSDGHSGFLFVNNYRMDYPLNSLKNLQLRVKFAAEQLTFPSQPIDIPSGKYAIWPVHFDLNGIDLRFATAQLVCSLQHDGESYFYFFAPSGVRADFSFDRASVKSLHAAGGATTNTDRQIGVAGVHPDWQSAIDLVAQNGNRVHIVLLTEEQAGNVWRLSDSSHTILVSSPADVFSDLRTLHLRSTDSTRLTYSVLPDTRTHSLPSVPAIVKVSWQQTKQAEASRPVPHGKYDALAPTDIDFGRAATWRINVPPGALDHLADLFLEIRYQGDVARLYEGTTLLDDNFYDGQPWQIGLKRFLTGTASQDFDLKILPLRQDASIFLPKTAWPTFNTSGDICRLDRITVIPVYEETLVFPR